MLAYFWESAFSRSSANLQVLQYIQTERSPHFSSEGEITTRKKMPSICPLNLLILNSINLGWRADSFTGKRVLVWTIKKVWFSLEKFAYQYIPLPALFLFPFPPVDSVSATALAEDSNFFSSLASVFFSFSVNPVYRCKKRHRHKEEK